MIFTAIERIGASNLKAPYIQKTIILHLNQSVQSDIVILCLFYQFTCILCCQS